MRTYQGRMPAPGAEIGEPCETGCGQLVEVWTVYEDGDRVGESLCEVEAQGWPFLPRGPEHTPQRCRELRGVTGG